MIKEKTKLTSVMTKMIREALRNNDDWIDGKSLGPNPRFFIVGDEPTMKDYLTKSPFSGSAQPMLTQLVQTLDERYDGVKMEDLHITYMIKTTFQKHQLTEDMVFDEWLPIIQLEYKISGCDEIVPLGRVAQLFAANIAQEPEVLRNLNAEAEAQAKAEDEAKAKAEVEAALVAESKAKALAESEARAKADAEAKEKYNRSWIGRIKNAYTAMTYGN